MSKELSFWPVLTINQLLVAIVFVAIFTMAVRLPADTDTWWHLRAGQYMVAHRTILTTDPFSHTRSGQTWIDHGWLAQLFWYGLYALGGWPALSLGLAALVTVSFWLVWKQMEGNVFIAAFSTVLGAMVSAVVWTARPQMVSFFLTALTAWLLHRFKRQNGHLLPWLPLVMLVWANVHGGYAIGFMLMLAYLVGEAVNHLTGHREDPVASWPRLCHLLIAMGLSLAVVVVNPHTWRMWLYPFQTVGIGALRDFIQEWQSPNFHLPYVQPFALMLVLVLVALGRAGRQADWADLGLTILWTGWALFAARNIAIFGLVVAPILARYANQAWNNQWQVWNRPAPFSRPGRPSVLNLLLLGLVVVAALVKIAIPLTPTARLKAEQESLPYAAVTFIRQTRPAGPLFNSYNWGGYLIFKLWPDYPVYIDGRTDLYDDAFIRRYLRVMTAADDWQQILNEDGINLVLIESNSTLAKLLRLNPAWEELYRDEMAVVFRRQGN